MDGAAPVAFTLVTLDNTPATDRARSDEILMQTAAESGPSAALWQAPQGLVVPRTYASAPHFDAVCQQFAAKGWPIQVRHSGGGVVPQGPGIINVSLAWPEQGKPLDHSDGAYDALCRLMSDALEPLGVAARPRAVEGSFCDGRFNLACPVGQSQRKIAGTAQLWRRQNIPQAAPQQIVLVHGLLLVGCDVEAVTDQANALEEALGQTRRYRADRAVSLHTLLSRTLDETPALVDAVRTRLHDRLRQGLCIAMGVLDRAD